MWKGAPLSLPMLEKTIESLHYNYAWEPTCNVGYLGGYRSHIASR